MVGEVKEITNGVKVLFEDNHIIVAIKPAGVLSQSDGSSAPDMLTILKAYIKEEYSKLYRSKGPVLTVERIERAEKPEQEVATFY